MERGENGIIDKFIMMETGEKVNKGINTLPRSLIYNAKINNLNIFLHLSQKNIITYKIILKNSKSYISLIQIYIII